MIEFPSGPTFSTEFRIRWRASFFSQFVRYAVPWRAGVFGRYEGIWRWLYRSGIHYSGDQSTNQPIIIHSPGEEFDADTSYTTVVDALPFQAEDADGIVYSCDHAPQHNGPQPVEGGGLPSEFYFANFSAQAQV